MKLWNEKTWDGGGEEESSIQENECNVSRRAGGSCFNIGMIDLRRGGSGRKGTNEGHTRGLKYPRQLVWNDKKN